MCTFTFHIEWLVGWLALDYNMVGAETPTHFCWLYDVRFTVYIHYSFHFVSSMLVCFGKPNWNRWFSYAFWKVFQHFFSYSLDANKHFPYTKSMWGYDVIWVKRQFCLQMYLFIVVMGKHTTTLINWLGMT